MKFFIGLVIILMTFTILPAEADTPTARAHWRDYALQELAGMEDGRAAGKPDDRKAHSYAYQTRLTAFKYGTWDHPEVRALLDKVYAQKKPGGYGMNEAWDAYGDGTVNPEDTVYTVTNADHVGLVLLEGYEAGVVDESEIYFIVDALMNQPVFETGHGKCISYSDQIAHSKDWCVVNVSLGAAAFLQKALDAGIARPGQQQLINDLKPFGAWSYEKADFELGSGAITRRGFWPYAYEKTQGYWRFSREGRAQDWNHNAYTAESAITLGMWQGMDSVQKMLDQPNYESSNYIESKGERKATKPREVQGRLRAQGLVPNYKPQNMWQDALYYQNNFPSRSFTDYAQGGFWAARLAENADGNSIVAKTADVLSTPKVYKRDNLKKGNPATVSDNSTIVLRSDVRQIDTSQPDNYDHTFIVYKNVEFIVDGVKVDEKTTGVDGNIAFVYTVRKDTCFVFRVPGEADSNKKCVNVT